MNHLERVPLIGVYYGFDSWRYQGIVTAGGDDPPGPPQVAQDPGGGHLPHLEPGHNSRAPRRPLLQTVQSGEVGVVGGSC